MFCILTFIQASIINAAKFKELIYDDTLGGSSIKLDDYLAKKDKLTYYIFRESYEADQATDYLTVQDTPENINKLKASFSDVSSYVANISDIDQSKHTIVYLKFEKAASFEQMSTFWVTFISVFILVVFCLVALLIWHFDRYDLDPANARLFISEAHKDSSIINEH